MPESESACYIIETHRQVVFGKTVGVSLYLGTLCSTPYPRRAKRYTSYKEATDDLPIQYYPNAKVWRFENNKLEEVTKNDKSNTEN